MIDMVKQSSFDLITNEKEILVLNMTPGKTHLPLTKKSLDI